ncbi:MAG: bifunctional serine/threonine-protein kinase/formylglycine-generating enzyme family protein [Microcoleus anatoxicus]|uniref:bifunctional serine/threonine-protein kinase/formylglycine-generating enzyme family protein n=1 Tax=Microcoleus anatoxicus TaxID=2705319 RepID=UPI00366D7B5E
MIAPDTILRKRYQIIKFLAGGGFGDTYLAKDLDLPGKPHCVVKHLKPKDNRPVVLQLARKLFDIEAQVLYNLGKQCPQIPTLFAHIEENGEFYLVQEFIDGHDLNTEIVPGKKLSESTVITLLKNILEVLTVPHEHQPNAVIHRDIKPANLMRRQDGKIVLIDFGAVRQINQLIVNVNGDVTTTIAIGTPGYMPSEQAKGKPKLCSDVYAVGMIGIQALTGIPPQLLQEDPMTGEVIWRQLVPRVDSRFADVLDKMVRDHFSQRYQNAGEALQALLSLSTNPSGSKVKTIPVIPQHTWPLPTNTTRRGLLQLAGFAGGGFALAVLSQSLLNNKSSSSSPSPSPPSDNEPPSPESSAQKSSPEPIAESPAPKPSPKPSPETPAPKASSNSLKTFDFETVTVNSTGQITNRSQGQVQVFTDNLGDGITIDMIAIPGGSFVMGSPSTEAERTDSEGPQRTVTVAPFFMGKYEVTQAQYQAVMGNNPSNFKGAKRPVESVNWDEAVEFCRKLTQKTGKSYRLPSEAEWEYACRAGTTTPFYFGDTITPDLVNYDGNYPYGAAPKGLDRQQTTDVGSFPPNSFGLYDMHGNVWEWCSDKYHDNYSGAPNDGSSWETGGSEYRVQRGGSWNDDAVNCHGALRGRNSAGNRSSLFGFRVALVSA